LLFPSILVFCCIGIYSINNSAYDVLFTAFFGLAGYLLLKLGFEPAPLLLGFVLGKLMEENLRRALAMSRGDPMTFLDRPVSLVLLLISLAMLVMIFAPALQKKREQVFTE
jgi:putative tricarboxylic transport membrane protein